MYCDNCNKEMISRESYHISSSRELNLLEDNGGNQNMSLRDNRVCYECMSKASKLLAKENRALKKGLE